MKFKAFVFGIVTLLATSALADTCAKSYMPLFTSYQGAVLCSRLGGATLNGNTRINANTGKKIEFAVGGTTMAEIRNDSGFAEITLKGTTPQIVGGSTSIQFRDSTDSFNNLLLADGGLVTTRGDFSLAQGKLPIWTLAGAAATAGTAVCNGVTPVVVATTRAATTNLVLFSLNTLGGTQGTTPKVSAVSAGVNFSFTCTASDTSTYNWVAIATQ